MTSPDDGHTWRIALSSRTSSKVVGEEHHHDAEGWYEHPPVEVRAWNLLDALRKAADLPLRVWFPEDPDEDPLTRPDWPLRTEALEVGDWVVLLASGREGQITYIGEDVYFVKGVLGGRSSRAGTKVAWVCLRHEIERVRG